MSTLVSWFLMAVSDSIILQSIDGMYAHSYLHNNELYTTALFQFTSLKRDSFNFFVYAESATYFIQNTIPKGTLTAASAFSR